MAATSTDALDLLDTASRKKIRSSCDNCSSSKVQCKKQTPKCHRCQRLGLQCIYGRSLRRGRPPAQNLARERLAASLDQPLLHSENDNSRTAWPDENSQSFPRPQNNTKEVISWNNHLNKGIWDIFPPVFSFGSPDPSIDPRNQKSPRGYSASIEATGQTLTTKAKSVICETPLDVGMLDVYQAFPSDEEPRSCVKTALQTLGSLYELEVTIPFDSVASRKIIESTRSSTQSLQRLCFCACPVCATDSGMPSVLAAIAAKTLSWYQILHQSENFASGYFFPPVEEFSLSAYQASKFTNISSSACENEPLFSPQSGEQSSMTQILLNEIDPFIRLCNGVTEKNYNGICNPQIFDKYSRDLMHAHSSLEANYGRSYIDQEE